MYIGISHSEVLDANKRTRFEQSADKKKGMTCIIFKSTSMVLDDMELCYVAQFKVRTLHSVREIVFLINTTCFLKFRTKEMCVREVAICLRKRPCDDLLNISECKRQKEYMKEKTRPGTYQAIARTDDSQD